MEMVKGLRRDIRRWLGIAAIQRQIRDLEQALVSFGSDLEAKVAISREDIERLNAATTRIAARVASLLDQVDALEANDDEVRRQQQLADIAQASADLRPVIEQLEQLGADASTVVPEPAPEQVPVEPGPDVTPVENLETVEETPAAPAEETPTSVVVDEPAPGEEAPVDSAPVVEPVLSTEETPAAPAEEPVPADAGSGEAVVSVPTEDATIEEVPAGESITVEAPADAPVTVITAPVDEVSGPDAGNPDVVEVPVSEASVEEVPAGETLEVAAPEDEAITVITAPSESVTEGGVASEAPAADAAGDTATDESV